MKQKGAVSIVTRLDLLRCGFPLSWQSRCKGEHAVCDNKMEQLREMCLFCQTLGTQAQYHPQRGYFTAIFGDGWELACNETAALAVQKKIQQKAAQYPDLVCYCFDPFSTLIYKI